MFDDPETALPVRGADARLFQGAHHVDLAGKLGGLGVDGGVTVHRNEIEHFGHIKMVEVAGERTEVLRHGNVRGQLAQQLRLHPGVGDDGVAAEAHPVEDESGIVHGGRAHGHRDVLEAGDRLAPETGAHHRVEPFDGLVFGFEPGMPVAARFIVEGGFGVVPAQAVVDLPGDELRMLAQRLGQRPNDPPGTLPVDIAVHAIGPASPFMQP